MELGMANEKLLAACQTLMDRDKSGMVRDYVTLRGLIKRMHSDLAETGGYVGYPKETHWVVSTPMLTVEELELIKKII